MCTSSSVYIIFTLRLYIELLSVSFWLRFVLVSMPSYLCCKTLLISLIIIFLLLRLWLSLRTKDRVWYSLFSLHLDATAVGSNVHFSFILFSYARFLCSVFISSKIFHFTSFFCSECAFARTIESVHAFGWHFTCSALVYKSSPMYAYTHTNAAGVCINIQRYVTIGQYKTRSNRHHTHSLNDFRTINQNKNE